ncbi:MAG: pyridoxal-phosphate dependent enzyme, partial [Candidatus Erginobacter occultus]|nr:pyridoxal-phosphate dependent enzyme [Candidatus Erginobacter occultus]
MENQAGNILELIGKTPIVRLDRVGGKNSAIVWGKCEYLNPMGSVKDRIALAMIETAEKEGRLGPGVTIVEPTSGNTGLGLAMVAAVKGYRLILTMPDTMSLERRKLLTALGAELVLTPGDRGMNGAIDEAERIIEKEPLCFMPQQFKNTSNPE